MEKVKKRTSVSLATLKELKPRWKVMLLGVIFPILLFYISPEVLKVNFFETEPSYFLLLLLLLVYAVIYGVWGFFSGLLYESLRKKTKSFGVALAGVIVSLIIFSYVLYLLLFIVAMLVQYARTGYPLGPFGIL